MNYSTLKAQTSSVENKMRLQFLEMVNCKELEIELKDESTNTPERVEELFDKYGYGKTGFKARTLYLAYIMGYAKNFDDPDYMKKMVASEKERKLKPEFEEEVIASATVVNTKTIKTSVKGTGGVAWLRNLEAAEANT